jgi:hypothetical protein
MVRATVSAGQGEHGGDGEAHHGDLENHGGRNLVGHCLYALNTQETPYRGLPGHSRGTASRTRHGQAERLEPGIKLSAAGELDVVRLPFDREAPRIVVDEVVLLLAGAAVGR